MTRRAGAGAGADEEAGTTESDDGGPLRGRRPVSRRRPSLRSDADSARLAFEAALAQGDVEECVAAILDLEEAIVAWSTDTDQNDDVDHARRVLRALVVRLGDLAAVGVRDPREVIGPYVEALLELRGRARASRDYAVSDLVRERLVAAGVEVRDTPEGAVWVLAGAT